MNYLIMIELKIRLNPTEITFNRYTTGFIFNVSLNGLSTIMSISDNRFFKFYVSFNIFIQYNSDFQENSQIAFSKVSQYEH